MSAIFETDNLCVRYGGDVALRGVTVSLEQGSIAGIVGESGSGKSTLLRAALDALRPGGQVCGGSIRFTGQDVTAMKPPERRAHISRTASFVSQDPLRAFSLVRTLGSQFEETALLREGATREEARARSLDLLGKLGLSDPARVLKSYVFELSGGIPENIEVNAKGVDKGRALLALAGRLGFSRGQTMACGDASNDVAMLRAAGLGVAMGNATPEAVAAADVQTDTNNNDGVAKAIRRWVLGEEV